MTFADKLSFLMKLTNTSNKQLADEIILDASQISRLRSGARKPTRNAEYISAMADFFADASRNDYQQVALAEKIDGLFPLRSLSRAVLAGKLLKWLTEEKQDNSEDEDSGPKYNSVGTFWGPTATTKAMDKLLSMALERGEPTLIQMYSDEEFVLKGESADFYKTLPDRLRELSDIGCNFQRISRPYIDQDYIFSSISLWLPVYMDGIVESYISPQLLESVYHRTIVVIHGIGTMVSTSVGNPSKSNLCYLFTDEAIIEYYAEEFNNYLSMCKVEDLVYKNKDALNRILHFMTMQDNINGDIIQENYSLSLISMPMQLYNSFIKDEAEHLYDNLQPFMNQRDDYLEGMGEDKFTDIINVLPPEVIRNGRAELSITYDTDMERRYYTPEEYRQHLLGIVDLLKKHKNYLVVIANTDKTDANMIFLYGDKKAVLTKIHDDLSLMEITDSELIMIFQQYLQQKYHLDNYTENDRRHVIYFLERLASKIIRE